jgi:hypothetical protein
VLKGKSIHYIIDATGPLAFFIPKLFWARLYLLSHADALEFANRLRALNLHEKFRPQ